jgi:hypothetical protein
MKFWPARWLTSIITATKKAESWRMEVPGPPSKMLVRFPSQPTSLRLYVGSQPVVLLCLRAR